MEYVEENDETNEEGFEVYQQSSSFHVLRIICVNEEI
jgi:hypothetical protein